MQDLLSQEYTAFKSQITTLTFLTIQQKFLQHQHQNPITKHMGQYIPKLSQYQQQFDMHKKQDDSLRKVPTFNGKKQFDNIDNLHRKVINIFKSFINSQIKDFRQYLRLTLDIDHLSLLLSRIQIQRFKNLQFNLIYFMFISTKRTIRIFIKLRQQIIKQHSFTPVQYMPISTHNSAKYKQRYHYIDKIMLSRKKKQWQDLIFSAGFQYDDEFTSFIFQMKDQVLAVQLVVFCLWLNKQTAGQSLSPAK